MMKNLKELMKSFQVVAAVIEQNGKIFCTQRGYGQFKGMWEFPGGKIEAGETHKQALVREIQEELGVTVHVGELLDQIEYDYPDFHLSLWAYACSLQEGSIELKEHMAAKWLHKSEIDTLNWLPADWTLIEKIKAI